MARFPSTFALDTGNKLNERFFDIRWLSVGEITPPKRWYLADEKLPDGEIREWGSAKVDAEGHLVAQYHREEVFGPLEDVTKLWFVLLDNRYIKPPHFVLFAYADDTFPPGTIVEGPEATKVLSKEHITTWAGMINWRSDDPMIQQIITAEKWRRKKIAVTMVGVCDVVNACYGFSLGRVLHGGAITTNDGEMLRNIYSGANDRIDPRLGSVNNTNSIP